MIPFMDMSLHWFQRTAQGGAPGEIVPLFCWRGPAVVWGQCPGESGLHLYSHLLVDFSKKLRYTDWYKKEEVKSNDINKAVLLCRMWLYPPYHPLVPLQFPFTCVELRANVCRWIRFFNSTLTFSQLSFYPKARESYDLEGHGFRRCLLLTLGRMGSCWFLHIVQGQAMLPDLNIPDSISRRSCCLSIGVWMGRQSLRSIL